MKINRQPAWVYLLDKVAENGVRYSIVIVLAWIGMMKFTSYEAGAIEGLVASSPLTSWLYSVFSLQGASNLIGLVEVATAIALLLAPVHRIIAIFGATSASLTFAITSSFLLSAPIAEPSLGGFPAISVVPGQFLLKDIVLLFAALLLLAKALLRDE
ncbi:YkgB family protein [Vibrio metoecus]|uniref:YkgB family protein n=1 Tax=Vibrio metoecus TaxID=1481663 RepID=UPI00215CFE29|nr:YkgB family protein [Vibrio metoecus]MCR9386464.1 YkgB family protein [Vibrio metoecus]